VHFKVLFSFINSVIQTDSARSLDNIMLGTINEIIFPIDLEALTHKICNMTFYVGRRVTRAQHILVGT